MTDKDPAPFPEEKGYSASAGYVKGNPANNDYYVNLWADDPWYYPILRAHDEITKLVPDYNISQIKEKFGGLRFYIDIPPETDETAAEKAREWARWAETFVDAMEFGRRWERGQINNKSFGEEAWWK